MECNLDRGAGTAVESAPRVWKLLSLGRPAFRIRADALALAGCGITHQQVADRLETLRARAAWKQDLHRRRRLARLEPELLFDQLRRVVHEYWQVEDHYEVEIMHSCGWQECPFDSGKPGKQVCGSSGTDIHVRNRRSRDWLLYSGLHIHLVRDHQFFEGVGLRYRLDPLDAIRVLEIQPGVDYAPKYRDAWIWHFEQYSPPGQALGLRFAAVPGSEVSPVPNVRVTSSVENERLVEVSVGAAPGLIEHEGALMDLFWGPGTYRFRSRDRTRRVE